MIGEIMKKYYKYLSLCLFFIVIFFLSPLSGDDWGNYIVGSEGVRYSLEVAVELYFNWEGRFISRVLINIFTYHKWLWNIINALVITSPDSLLSCPIIVFVSPFSFI